MTGALSYSYVHKITMKENPISAWIKYSEYFLKPDIEKFRKLIKTPKSETIKETLNFTYGKSKDTLMVKNIKSKINRQTINMEYIWNI